MVLGDLRVLHFSQQGGGGAGSWAAERAGLGLAPTGAKSRGGDTDRPHMQTSLAVPHTRCPLEAFLGICPAGGAQRGHRPQGPGGRGPAPQVLSVPIIRTERKGRTIMLGQITAPRAIFLMTVTPGKADQVMGTLGVFKNVIMLILNCYGAPILAQILKSDLIFHLSKCFCLPGSFRRAGLRLRPVGVSAGWIPDSSWNRVRWVPGLHLRLASLEPGSAPAPARPEPAPR